MKTLIISLAILSVAFAGVVHAGQAVNPAKFCKDGGTDLIATALEDALFVAHGIPVDLDISQGACVSTVATHTSASGVNTTALATDFCKQAVGPGSDLAFCVEHVEPALLGIFHPAP